MATRKLPVLFLIMTLSLQTFAQNGLFYLRTPTAPVRDYGKYLESIRGISYIDWVLFKNQKNIRSAVSLNEALETSAIDPLRSLPMFDAAIVEIENSILNQSSRDLLISIYEKIYSLDIPSKTKELYTQRRQSLLDLQSGTTLPGKKKEALLQQKDLDLTLTRIRNISGFEDSALLVNGLPADKILPQYWPLGRNQWTLLSNVYPPQIFNSTWNEFQQSLQIVNKLQPLAEGNCQDAHLSVSNLNLQLEAAIFVSSDCIVKNLAPDASGHNSLNNGHLGSVDDPGEVSQAYSWLIPVGLFLGAAVVYGLRNKHVTLQMPKL